MAARQSGNIAMTKSLRTRDIIDARPFFTQEDADGLNERFRDMDTATMLKTVFAEGQLGQIGLVSSFGTEAAVLLHLVANADPNIPVIFVDTLKMFPETLEYRELLIQELGINNAQVVKPKADTLAAKDENGLRWSYDPDGCCAIRKVEPLARAKEGLDTWISGRKAFQSTTRENLPRFEVVDGKLKINPLGDWTKDDLDSYFEEHDIPRHPLEAQGYLSIGCAPCTSKVKPGEDPRAGRWRGWDKTECGIHEDVTPLPGADDDGANDPIF